MPILDWTQPIEAEGFLAEKGSGFIFKHSTRCPISAEADRAFAEFLRREPEAPVHRVLVIESRPASTAISTNLGIPHESPQAILLRDGVPVWSASHWDITAGALLTAWSEGGPRAAP